jgi:hypothetical protein
VYFTLGGSPISQLIGFGDTAYRGIGTLFQSPAQNTPPAVVANFKKILTMRYLFAILISSISFFTFGQSLNETTVQINGVLIDSLTKYVVKMNETEYSIDAPYLIKPKWIEEIKVLISEEKKNIYGNGNVIIIIYPKKRYFRKIGLILDKVSNTQKKEDLIIIEGIVNNFFNWYMREIKINNSIEFMPCIVENEQGMTTLDFSRYLENLRNYQFSDSLIEFERLSYLECIYHLEKIKYSDFKSSWTDLDHFESTNCDFANSYRWTGGMEPVDCIKIVDVKIISNQTGLVHLKFCGIDSNNKEIFWGEKTVTLEKKKSNWKITRID